MTSFKVCGKKRPWADLRPRSRTCLEWLKNTEDILSQDSRSPGRHLKPETADYEAGLQRSFTML
jgi:hypothetical protein